MAQGELELNPHYLQAAFMLNVLYMAVCASIFHVLFEQARKMGYLAKYGT